MSLTAGTRLGPYEIVSPLGAGGMGEVYRARDTRLNRDVAVKVLPPGAADRADLRERFEREARAVSSLNHAHICALYDIGREGDADYLVMEYLEGETLAARLARGSLPIEHALRIAVEIADALDRAHRQGVVHRDLKPANIMLTARSGAKLLDFGLAKAHIAGAAGSALTAMPTGGPDLTAEGTILGTLQYMAPEQLEGREADARTDIFALGLVLYEMLTGRRAFEGRSQASLIAAILEREPAPISAVQPMTPPSLDRLVRTCLAKDPEDRWQTAHDVMLEMRWIAEGGSQSGIAIPAARAPSRRREAFAWALAGLALAASLFAFRLRGAPDPDLVVRSSIAPPAGFSFSFVNDDSASLSISPDGRLLTFAARGPGGRSSLWLRSLDEFTAKPLPGTEGAMSPFWSPDSRFIGFFEGGKLKRIPLAGGPAVTICDAGDPRGATWNHDGVIVFEPHWREPLYKVAATGGLPEPVTKLDETRSETTHRWPWFLPDGRHYLYLAGSHSAEVQSPLNTIYVASLDSPERKALLSARSNAIYVKGHLLYLKDNYLVAQAFDPERLELRGEPVTLADGVEYIAGYFRAVFAASENGTLLFAPSGQATKRQLAWHDRTGRLLGTLGDPDIYLGLRLSPDGQRVAVSIGDPPDIWIYEISRGIRTRLTTHGMSEFGPVWSPDGRRILYLSDRNIASDIFAMPTDGAGREEPVLQTPDFEEPSDWSRDGRLLAFDHARPRGGGHNDIWILPMTGDRKPYPYLETEFDERFAVFSPDQRWIVYTSDESGRSECYVRPFPFAAGKWQVSTAGAEGACWWRGDGKEIFYGAPDGSVMSVAVTTQPAFLAQAARPLFRLEGIDSIDSTADGQRFLLTRRESEAGRPPISLILNWFAGSKRRSGS
ncbi:MAG TPA: protein kinase [Candidatus Polarisedimenticolia bacterium]|jgi:serine/threonine protein kinase